LNYRSVDVVIPCYNGEAFLRRSVESVVNQTYKVTRIILVNDGSTDNSLGVMWDLARQYSNVKVVTQSNGGLSRARNTGIRNSKSELVAFLDVDDYWLGSKLENQIKLLDEFQEKQPFAIASNYHLLQGEALMPGIRNPKTRLIDQRNLLLFRVVIPGSGSSILLSRSIIDACGFFDENLAYGEDLDYWVRVSRLFSWRISEKSDVVIYSNSEGMQSRARKDLQPFLDGSRNLLLKHSSELSGLDLVLIRSYIETLAHRISRSEPASSPQLGSKVKIHVRLMGTAYALFIKLDRRNSARRFGRN
jgi:glycosyltransferase involved in cell wall biosynthesis